MEIPSHTNGSAIRDNQTPDLLQLHSQPSSTFHRLYLLQFCTGYVFYYNLCFPISNVQHRCQDLTSKNIWFIPSTSVLYTLNSFGDYLSKRSLWSQQNITAHTYFLPRSHSSLSRISYFPCNVPFASPSWPEEIYYKLQSYPSPICHPSGPEKLLERCSHASRGVDAAGGHVLGVAVKQASNDTPCNHSKKGGVGHALLALTQEMLW